jgi:hypothetical protein
LVVQMTSSPWCGVKNTFGIFVYSKENTIQSCDSKGLFCTDTYYFMNL